MPLSARKHDEWELMVGVNSTGVLWGVAAVLPHAAAYAAKEDPAFMEVLVRHIRHKGAFGRVDRLLMTDLGGSSIARPPAVSVAY